MLKETKEFNERISDPAEWQKKLRVRQQLELKTLEARRNKDKAKLITLESARDCEIDLANLEGRALDAKLFQDIKREARRIYLSTNISNKRSSVASKKIRSSLSPNNHSVPIINDF